MSPLEQHLIARIQNSGSITFADFMECALYDPLHGYYAAGRARIGASGDFVTAVSTGPLFGRLLARQFHEMWTLLDAPARWVLVEQGAFDGRLCADILEALQIYSPECFKATAVHIVEPFSLFQRRQAKTLHLFASQVTWHRTSETLPAFTGVHYSNELLDAFPVHILRHSGTAWKEQRVCVQDCALAFELHPIRDAVLAGLAGQLGEKEAGFTTEAGMKHRDWLAQIRAKMISGWVLTFDYGMSQSELLAPHRKDGTASAYRSHRREGSLLARAGAQDLTAHVNFTTLTRDALEAGWTLAGYTDQHRFFTGLAPLHFRNATEALTLPQQRELLEFRTLTHPQLMGFQFKAWCVSCGKVPAVSGFQHARDPQISLDI
jgi:SAM-dependent MidA family methyltransferase